MWFASKVLQQPIIEPVTLAEAQKHCRAPEADFTAELTQFIKAARAHVERYCNARFAEQTLQLECGSFSDFERLPEAPLKSVTEITYLDHEGNNRLLSPDVYEVSAGGYYASIGLKQGQQWPTILAGSRIKVKGVFGGDCPEDVKVAILVFVAYAFLNRENPERKGWTIMDALLANHRRGAW